MLKDDVNRFQIETEEKKLKKRNTQADYKSYLERQMDHHKAQKVIQISQNVEEGYLIKSKVQSMREAEN